MATQTKRKSPASVVAKPIVVKPVPKKAIAPDVDKEPDDVKVTISANEYQKLVSAMATFIEVRSKEDASGVNGKIRQDESIEVISLSPMEVNAVTGGDRAGRVYTFRGFGTSMVIPYSDLVNIVQHQFRLFEYGYLYVNDARFAKVHGLELIMNNILTKEQINAVVYSDFPEYADLFEKATSVQREAMSTMLISELNKGSAVDYNKIKKISDFVGYDLGERAQQLKDMFAETKE